MANIQKVQFDDTATSLMQDNLVKAITPLANSPLAGARLIVGAPLVNGANVIPHGLGRKLSGWFPVGTPQGWSSLYDTQVANQRPDLTLQLTIAGLTGTARVNLIVF